MKKSILLSLTILAACASTPDKATKLAENNQSQSLVAANFKEIPNQEALQNPNFWQEFKDEKLNSLINKALSDNFDLQAASSRIESAKAASERAKTNLFPFGVVEASAAKSQQSLNAGLGQLSKYVPNYSRGADDGLVSSKFNWDLDVFGQARDLIAASNATKAQAQIGLEAAKLAISSNIARAYFGIRLAQNQKEILLEIKSNLQSQRKIYSVMNAAGQITKTAIEKIDGEIIGLDANIEALDSLIKTNIYQIASLVGENPSVWESGLNENQNFPEIFIPASQSPIEIISNRPDIGLAFFELQKADANLAAQMKEYYPKITFGAALGYESNQFSSVFENKSGFLQGIIGLNWRIFDFKRIEAEIEAAKGAKKAALMEYRQSLLNATAQIEIAYAELKSTFEKYGAQAAKLDLESNSYARVLAEYDIGQKSELEKLKAENILLQIQSAKIIAKGEAVQAMLNCLKQTSTKITDAKN